MSTESPPLLTPQNRRLRHLRGLYLRNLTFARPALRTVDDSGLNGPPPSARKGKGRRRSSLGELHGARSSESLAAGTRRASVALGVGVGPAERQRRLQGSVDGRVADGFFSLHCEGEPVYFSEVVERASNFNFRFFDLAQHDPGVTRSSEVTVKFWARRHGAWCLLLEDAVDLRSLHFLGSLENKHFPPNALVFHLADGMYSADLATKPRTPKAAPPLPTSSYNALMKLATLDTSIQDALATHHAITAQINAFLEASPPDPVPAAADSAAQARRQVEAERRAVAASKRRKTELRDSIAARRAAMREGRALQAAAETDVANASSRLVSARESVARTRELIRGQRRRVVSDLGSIFPIESLPGGRPLSFAICGLALPNTTLGAATSRSADEDALSAALGHAALLSDMLQYYLGTPLPYPLTALGSRSSARDDISMLADLGPPDRRGREFPLYLPRGGSTAGHFRFEYAWFLLNKDVEALCVGRGLRVVDIRETLPNLKYLVYVCCAGEQEVPERKRGGVRGLWAADGRADGGMNASKGGTPGNRSPVGGEPGKGLEQAKGLPFREEEVKLTLRTKGLRENVSR